jgi:hypothetical protein
MKRGLHFPKLLKQLNDGAWATRHVVIAVLLVIFVTACGSSSTPEDEVMGAVSTSTLHLSAAVAVPGVDAGVDPQIRQYLDSVYKASDVRYSFRSKFAEDVDCIDFYAQRGVKELVAQGETIQSPPPFKPDAPFPISATNSTAAVFFNGEPDENGHPRKCPSGTIPQIRITPDMINAAGGLAAYTHALTHKLPPPPLTPPPPAPIFAHVTATWPHTGSTGGFWNNGGQMVTPIVNPTISPTAHSLAQLWVTVGNGIGNGCGNNCVESVELGWNVDSRVYPGNTATHLFIYSTKDGYNRTGCYNNNGGGGQTTCVKWVQTSSTIAPGMTLASGFPADPQLDLYLLAVNYDNGANMAPNWWLYAQTSSSGDWIGYYQSSEFANIQGGIFQYNGDNFLVGGEVESDTTYPGIRMGTGSCGEDERSGQEASAYMYDAEVRTMEICSPGGCQLCGHSCQGATLRRHVYWPSSRAPFMQSEQGQRYDWYHIAPPNPVTNSPNWNSTWEDGFFFGGVGGSPYRTCAPPADGYLPIP